MVEFVRSVPCELGRLSTLRRELDGWLACLCADQRLRKALVLAAHEAAANAIEHGRCAKLEIRGRVEDHEILLEVRADGKWKPATSDNEERGRGLQLNYGLMEDVEIDVSDHRTEVRMRLSYIPVTDKPTREI